MHTLALTTKVIKCKQLYTLLLVLIVIRATVTVFDYIDS